MSDLVDIQSQIEKLQKQAQEIKAREFDKTVQDILVKMTAFGITLKDLQPGKSSKLGKAAKGRSAKGAGNQTKVASTKAVRSSSAKSLAGKPVAAKFAGPNGESWSGRGLTPRWLAALVAQGQSKDSFAIKP